MKVDLATTAMIGGKVKNHVYAVNYALRDSGLPLIRVYEFNVACLDMFADVFEFSATQIIGNSKSGLPEQ